jgi:hypothetical protein
MKPAEERYRLINRIECPRCAAAAGAKCTGKRISPHPERVIKAYREPKIAQALKDEPEISPRLQRERPARQIHAPANGVHGLLRSVAEAFSGR